MNMYRVFGLLSLATLFVGCVVESSSAETCDPGEVRDCSCGDRDGTQTCFSDGDGFGRCECEGGSGGSGGGTGSGGASTGGSGGGSSGAGTGGSMGGSGGSDVADAGLDAAVPDGSTTDGSTTEEGGADASAADAMPDVTETPDAAADAPTPDFTDDCLNCAEVVCENELNDCVANDVCFPADNSGELVCMLECMNIDRKASANGFVSPGAVQTCGESTCGTSGWPGGVDATTSALVDCLAGSPTWPSDGPWQSPGQDNCTFECFGAGGS